MAKIAPFFITGANAKIKLNGVTLAFCTNLSYSVVVNTAAPHILGMYEASTLEPLSYNVTGSFGVVRYANNVKSQLEQLGYNTPNGVTTEGNGVGSWTKNSGDDLGTSILSSGTFGNDGRAQDNFDPSMLQYGTFFDIEVYQKMPGNGENRGVCRLRNCRLVRMDGQMNKKTPLLEQFQFQALYYDGDSFIADFSGSGQQFE